jgi:hypothetical protein
VVVLWMGLQVVGELVNTICQQRDLNIG